MSETNHERLLYAAIASGVLTCLFMLYTVIP